MSKLRLLSSMQEIEECLQALLVCNERMLLREACALLLTTNTASQSDLIGYLINFVHKAPYLIDLVFQSSAWESQRTAHESTFTGVAIVLVEQLILSANAMRHFVRQPLQTLLRELESMSVQTLASLVELVSLAVRDAETALDILLEIVEPETGRLLVDQPEIMSQCVKSLIGIALDHIDEASSNRKSIGEPLQLVPDDGGGSPAVVRANIRVDSPLNGDLKKDDHIRLTVPNSPKNSPAAQPFSMDAIVVKSELGEARFRCIHEPPSYYQECVWNLSHCGSFVTAKAMLDALMTFFTDKEQSCRLFRPLVGLSYDSQTKLTNASLPFTTHKNLNPSQNRALEAAMTNLLTFLWGPPGTGKTHTIVIILIELLNALPDMRVLVAAPTHNAVDNILQKFIAEDGMRLTGVKPLRVSTSVRSSDSFEAAFNAIFTLHHPLTSK